MVGNKPVGALTFTTVYGERSWPNELVKRLKLVSEILANALDRKQKEKTLHTALSEIKQLKDRLEKENIFLRQEIEVKYHHNQIVGQSSGIKGVLALAEKVAEQNTSVLISGETGTGKELLCRYPWPGNVRELKNVIERALILNTGSNLVIDRIESADTSQALTATREDMIRHHILKVLESTRWRVSGKEGAAEILGMKRTTLLTKMKKYNIQRPA